MKAVRTNLRYFQGFYMEILRKILKFCIRINQNLKNAEEY